MRLEGAALLWLTGCCLNHLLVSAHGDRRADMDDDHCKFVQTIDVQPGIQTLAYTSTQDFQRKACFYWKFRTSSSDQIWLTVPLSQQLPGRCPRAKLLLTDDDHEMMVGGWQWRQQTTSFWSKEKEVQVFFKPSSCDRSFSLQYQAVSRRYNPDVFSDKAEGLDDDDDDENDDDRKAPSTRLLVGTILGGLAVLLVVFLIIIVAVCIRRRRRCQHARPKTSGYSKSTATLPISPRGPPDFYAAPYDNSAPEDNESFKKVAPPGDGTEPAGPGEDKTTFAPPSLVVPVAPPPYPGPGLFTTEPSGVGQELPPSYRDATYHK